MKILGVNISHNCSFAYFESNLLKEYYEEDRFNKDKGYMPDDDEDCNYTYQYKALEKFKDITFDVVAFASYDRGHLQIELPIIKHILKQVKYKKYYFDINKHHIYHANCGYYFSKFDEATAVVVDGGGERFLNKNFQTMESIFSIDKDKITTCYKHISNIRIYTFNDSKEEIEFDRKVDGFDLRISNKSIGGYKYMEARERAGFKKREEGQLMGIAAYKNKKTNLDKKVLDIAHQAQEETLKERIELIKKALTYSSCKNIILSGGYHLNCLNNFKLVKHFPELNFFVDPIPYDGGTAVGVAHYYENYLQ